MSCLAGNRPEPSVRDPHGLALLVAQSDWIGA